MVMALFLNQAIVDLQGDRYLFEKGWPELNMHDHYCCAVPLVPEVRPWGDKQHRTVSNMD
jgi:hypothetical protein